LDLCDIENMLFVLNISFKMIKGEEELRGRLNSLIHGNRS